MPKNAVFALINAGNALNCLIMDLQQIRYFLGLAKELHFWKTSEKMFVTQSALSRRIQSLEAEIGVSLFERNKRNVKLTAAGAFLQTEWTRILIEIENAHRHARQISAGEIGKIKIAHPGSITHSILPDLLAALIAAYPNLEVELFELLTENFEQALINYQIDIGFARELPANQSLTSQPVSSENFALVVPENHRLTTQNFTNLGDAKGENFILPSLNSRNAYAESLREIFALYKYTPKTIFESDFGATILSLVGKGLGVSLMPISYSHHAPAKVRFIETSHQTTLFIVWRKDEESAVLKNFIKLIEQDSVDLKS